MEYNSEIRKVKKLLVYKLKKSVTYKATSLKGGVAIMCYSLGDPSAAFWIKNNIVYAANGTAMAWSGGSIDYSPVGIDYGVILKIINHGKI